MVKLLKNVDLVAQVKLPLEGWTPHKYLINTKLCILDVLFTVDQMTTFKQKHDDQNDQNQPIHEDSFFVFSFQLLSFQINSKFNNQNVLFTKHQLRKTL